MSFPRWESTAGLPRSPTGGQAPASQLSRPIPAGKSPPSPPRHTTHRRRPHLQPMPRTLHPCASADLRLARCRLKVRAAADWRSSRGAAHRRLEDPRAVDLRLARCRLKGRHHLEVLVRGRGPFFPMAGGSPASLCGLCTFSGNAAAASMQHNAQTVIVSCILSIMQLGDAPVMKTDVTVTREMETGEETGDASGDGRTPRWSGVSCVDRRDLGPAAPPGGSSAAPGSAPLSELEGTGQTEGPTTVGRGAGRA